MISWMIFGSFIGLTLDIMKGMPDAHIGFVVLICSAMGGMFGHRYAMTLRLHANRKAYVDLKAGLSDEIIHAFTCMEKAVGIRTRNKALLARFQNFQLKFGLTSGANGNGMLQIVLQAIDTELRQSQAELHRANILEASARQIMINAYDEIEQAHIRTL